MECLSDMDIDDKSKTDVCKKCKRRKYNKKYKENNKDKVIDINSRYRDKK